MKNKKLICWLLVIVFCFTLASCGDKAPVSSNDPSDVASEVVSDIVSDTVSETSSNPDASVTSSQTEEVEPEPWWDGPTPLLYRVTDDENHVAWVFGSIHVGREDFYPFPDYLYYSYHNAEVLAVEADVVEFQENLEAQIKALTNFVYLDGTTIRSHLSDDVYAKAVEILTENGVYTSDLDYYCPYFWANTIDSFTRVAAEIDESLGIDINLIYDAKQNEKNIDEIESIDFQYKMLSEFSDQIQEMLLISAIEGYENPERFAEEADKLLDLWAAGDEEALAEYFESEGDEMTDAEKELYEEYHKAMITDRNVSMTEYVEKALESGKKTFVCVGAAHVVGEGGIIDLLEQKDYNIIPVTITKYPVTYSYLWE